MGRPTRLLLENSFYHVFNRGIARKSIYFSKYHSDLFIHLLQKTSKKFNLEVHSYCLMKNHYHLLIKTLDANLDKAMQYFSSMYARTINREINSDGALFKGRYRSILVDSDRYLMQVCRYIHLNPVEANIAVSPEDYPLSSYTQYINPSPQYDWINTQFILSNFLSLQEFVDYIHLGIDKNIKSFYSKKNIPQLLSL